MKKSKLERVHLLYQLGYQLSHLEAVSRLNIYFLGLLATVYVAYLPTMIVLTFISFSSRYS